MASLAETAYYTRQTIKFGAVALVALIIARFVLNSAQDYLKQIRPPKEEPPTVGFSKLPPIQFPAKEIGEITMILEPVPGGVLQMPNRANVYFVPSKKPHLFALEKTIDRANKLGFQFEPRQISDTVYEWTKTSPLVSRLKLETVTTVFDFSSHWRDDPSIWVNKAFISQTAAVGVVTDFLRRSGVDNKDITSGRSVVTPLKWMGTDLVMAVSLSEADFLQVDLFRAQKEDYDFVTAEPDRGIVRALVSLAQDGEKRILETASYYRPASLEQPETYPILTATEAWQAFSQAKSFIALVPEDKNIVVRRIYLAYFDSYEKQDFIQPIYVFEGEGFLGYYPAVRPEWIVAE